MINYATNNLGILKIKCQQLIQLAKKKNSNNVNRNDMMQKKQKKHVKLFFKKMKTIEWVKMEEGGKASTTKCSFPSKPVLQGKVLLKALVWLCPVHL